MQTLDDAQQVQDDLVLQALITHRTGLRVLLAPERPEQAELVLPDHFAQIISVLRQRHAFTVIDAWPPNDPRMLIALKRADLLLIPVGPDLPAMKNLTSLLHVIGLITADQRKVTPILIGADGASGDRIKALEAIIKRELKWRIVSDELRVKDAANTGVPFVLSSPEAEISRNIQEIARYCMEAPGEEAGAKKAHTGFSRLFRR
jgi:pilus assembly protein CpaE